MKFFKNIKKQFQFEAWHCYKKILEKEHNLCYLFWEATLACDLSCKHCGSDCSKSIDTSNELNKDEVINFFESFSKDFPSSKIMVAITGGEPIIRPDLFEITEKISSLGFNWGLVTNGYRVDEKIVKSCKETNMKTICISIDGTKEYHEWLRGKGTFERAKNAVHLFKEANFLHSLQVSSVITHSNIDDLEKSCELMNSLDIDEWRLIQVAPIGRADENDKLTLRPKDYIRLFSFIKDKRKTTTKPRITLCEEGFLGMEWEREVRTQFYQCDAGIRIGGILANGDISACPSIPRVLVQGNIRRDSFKKIWDEKFEKFRDRSWMKQGECASCSSWRLCQGNSLHLWDFEKNRPKICHIKMVREGVSN